MQQNANNIPAVGVPIGQNNICEVTTVPLTPASCCKILLSACRHAVEVVANFFPPTVVTSLMLFWPMGTPTAGMLCAAATCAGAPGALCRSSGACGHEAKDSNFSNACLTNASASSLHVAGCWLWHGQSCRRFPLRSHCSQGVCLITYLFRSFFPVTAIPCDQSLLYGA